MTISLFPSVPLCIDAGALTGRIWCPVNMRNEPDPHWKEFPRNWSHPVSFFLLQPNPPSSTAPESVPILPRSGRAYSQPFFLTPLRCILSGHRH
jgi:hypothetical protein